MLPIMRVWLDTEFKDNGSAINVSTDLISIGLVREDGRELYLENAGAIFRGDRWLDENVAPKLSGKREIRLWTDEIAKEVETFCSDIKPQFWAYYASYDWMLLCKLYGSMLTVPKRWPHFCRDVKQLMWHLRIDSSEPGLPYQSPTKKHHALEDARWLRDVHLWIDQNYYLEAHKLVKPHDDQL